MNCPTKRYWITYFTNKGDHLLYFDHWLTVSWSRYDKRLKPPSEGALRVRSSPQRLLHRPFKAFYPFMSFCLRLLFCLLQFTPSLSYPIFFPHYFTRWSCSYSLLLSNFPSSSSQINISMSLLSLSSPDESSLHYEIEFIIKQKWIDPRLVHDDGNRWKKKVHFMDFFSGTQPWTLSTITATSGSQTSTSSSTVLSR